MSRTHSFNQFDGGMTNDPRNPSTAVCRSIKHFDNYSRSLKLTPYRDMEKDATTESDLNTLQIQKFLVAQTNTTTNVVKFYGLGIKGGKTQIYSKTSSPSVPADVWVEAAGTSVSVNIDAYLMFVYYQNYLYGTNAAGIWKYGDITLSPTITENVASAITSGIKATGQGFVSPKFNILYVPSGRYLLQNSSGAWTTACTFPEGSTVLTPCEQGNLIAIPVNNPDGSTTIYLWDTQTTVNDFSEKIDAGMGKINLVESIGGVLCWIMVSAIDTNTSITNHVFFKYWSGSQVVLFEDYLCDSFSNIGTDRQKFNDLFYFLADMTLSGVAYRGLWKIFKKADGRMTVSFDRLPRNDTALDANSLLGFYRWGDYVFIAYKIPTTGAFTVWHTNHVSGNYTATSIIETVINPGQPEEVRRSAGPRSNNKQLKAVALSTEPLTGTQQVVLKYRVDGGSWTTILTNNPSTAPNLLTTPEELITCERVFDATGTAFTSGREYEFRIESTNGAEITELKYSYEVLNTLFE